METGDEEDRAGGSVEPVGEAEEGVRVRVGEEGQLGGREEGLEEEEEGEEG